MANPSLQIGNSNWAIKEDNLLGYSTAGTRFVPQPITMTRESAGTRVNSSGLVETVELLGSEEVTNGSFAINGVINTVSFSIGFTSSDTEVSIANSILNLTNAAVGGFDGRVRFTNGVDASGFLTIGNQYLLEYTITENNDSSNLNLFDGNSYEAIDSSVGTHKHYYEAEGVSVYLRNTTNNTNIKFSSLSLKESTKNNLARVDYDGTASSLLVEPERTNLLTYSEDFSTSAGWGATGAVVTPNQAISPDGTLNATLVELDTNADRLADVLSSTGGTYTFSFYVKAKEGESGNWASRVVGDSSLFTTTFVDDSAWVRVSQEFTKTGSGNIIPYPAYRLNGTSTLFNAYIWGAQIEEATYATSYIPTDGGTVTRVKDQYSKTGISNLINSEEGVLFVEMAALSDDETNREITLSDGTGSNYVLIRFNSGGSNRIYTRVDVGGALEYYDLNTSHTITNNNKIAIRWGASNFATFINGVEAGSQLSGSSFSADTLNNLSFDNGAGGGNFYGKVKQLQVYKTADIDLAALTS